MNYWAPFRKTDVANGDGVRVTLFVTGCRIHCKDCFNSECWSFDSGVPFTEEVAEDVLKACEPDWINGLTILGGEPFEEENQKGLLPLVQEFRKRFGDSKTLWMYTGYVWDRDLVQGGRKWVEDLTDRILAGVDVLVDGPFVAEKKDLALRFRGSSNQRILHFVERGSQHPVIEGGD